MVACEATLPGLSTDFLRLDPQAAITELITVKKAADDAYFECASKHKRLVEYIEKR